MTKIIADVDLPQVECMSTEGAKDARQANESASESEQRRSRETSDCEKKAWKKSGLCEIDIQEAKSNLTDPLSGYPLNTKTL